jgi:serine/threonine-protein kinase RsbW
VQKVVIPTELKAAKAVADEVLRQVRLQRYGEEAQFAIKLALEEALVNAIKHGNQCQVETRVIVEYDVNARQAVIQITDEGRGFDPESLPDPTADENLECPCGRGVMLMRAYMDEVQYNTRGNSVRMVKRNRKV